MDYMMKIKNIFNIQIKENNQTIPEYYPLSKTCQIPPLSIIYTQYFGHKNNGTFVEFGAFDGEYSSNTSGLADIGWFGHYIEPIPEFNKKCKQRHSNNKNTKIYEYAIGSNNEFVNISVGGPLSTINPKMKSKFQQLDWSKSCFEKESIIKVEQITLENFLTKNYINPNFEILIVDVEGLEWDVFRNFDLSKWHPQMVIIELHDQNPDYLDIRTECNNLVCYFKSYGYKIIYKDLINTIYVPDAHISFKY